MSTKTIKFLFCFVIYVILFIAVSFFLSHVVVKSLNDFKHGLLSFFDYLNKKTNTGNII